MIHEVKLIQKEDSCSDECCQNLIIEIRDGGGGPYLCFSTKEWAIDCDDLDEMVSQLKILVAQYDPNKLYED